MGNQFFIVMDGVTGWGIGKTRAAAIQEAAQWLCDEDGQQGVSVEQVEAMIISEQESRNGVSGVFIAEITDTEWPENAYQLDGDDLAAIWTKQQEIEAE
ncbi:hypothetical protein ACNPKZ_20180 [Shewanella algae]|uniref:hypothetical protein n=1 Tax=Shewanella algae TaxID=38313 RepID=UPI000B343C9F|nr:hypothetical protein KVP08_022705 [Shewanella putrefaciens]